MTRRIVIAFMVWLALAQPAVAALGESAASVSAEAARLSANVTEERAATHTIMVLDMASGLTVRQWLNPQGRVFAITWSGPVMPDLALFLGSHYDTFKRESQRPGPPRGALRVDTPELVVESAGRLRAYRGRAFVPALLPAGLRAQDIS